MPKRWTDEAKTYLTANYATSPMTELIAVLNRTEAAIHTMAWEMRLARPNPRNWKESELEFLRANWATMPTRLVVAHLGRDYESVRMQAQRLTITKVQPGLKHSINPNAFSPLTPDSAYVVGYILADGCINHDGGFTVSSKDKEMLTKILSVLGASNTITESKKGAYGSQYAIAIGHAGVTAQLVALGLTPRKSLTATMPTIPDALFFHFLRGYFDGDGNAFFHQVKHWLAVTIVSGSERLLLAMSTRIATLTSLPERTLSKSANGRGWLLKYHGPDALVLADAMYVNAGDLYLDRKRQPFERYRTYRATLR